MKIGKARVPENKEYWLDEGYSTEEAEIMAQRHKGSRAKQNVAYWLNRGYNLELAEKLAEEQKMLKKGTRRAKLIQEKFGGNEESYKTWARENCSLTKENMLKRMTQEEYETLKHKSGMMLIGKRPTDDQYWLDRGFTLEEAKQKRTEHAKTSTPRCVEYWINKGYSEEKAKIEVSKYQDNCSLESFKSRYGEELGEQRYERFVQTQKETSVLSALYWMKQGLTEEEAISKVSEIQTDISKQSPVYVEYWIKRGYDLEEAEELRVRNIQLKFANCLEYWLDKGYTEEESIENVKRVQSERGIRAQLKIGTRTSSLEVIFDKATSRYDKIWCSSVKRDDCNRYFFVDFEFEKCIVEIYGDYWHANPNVYSDDLVVNGLTATQIREWDAKRKEMIERITGKPVFVIWESEFPILEEKINEISAYF